jgi:hypothetical protein
MMGRNVGGCECKRVSVDMFEEDPTDHYQTDIDVNVKVS